MEHFWEYELQLREVAILDGQRSELGKSLQHFELIEQLLGPTAEHHLMDQHQLSMLGAAKWRLPLRLIELLVKSYVIASRLLIPPWQRISPSRVIHAQLSSLVSNAFVQLTQPWLTVHVAPIGAIDVVVNANDSSPAVTSAIEAATNLFQEAYQ